MLFRDFVELVRDALQALAFNVEGSRDLTPMLHLDTPLGLSTVPIDRRFFDTSTSVQLLIERYVIPLLKESEATKLAWTYCAWTAPNGGERPAAHPDRREILLATFIDPEVIEHWAAPLIRTGGPVVVGNWRSSVPNVGGGPFLTTIQEALR